MLFSFSLLLALLTQIALCQLHSKQSMAWNHELQASVEDAIILQEQPEFGRNRPGRQTFTRVCRRCRGPWTWRRTWTRDCRRCDDFTRRRTWRRNTRGFTR